MSFYTKEKQYCTNLHAILFSLLNLKHILEYKVWLNILEVGDGLLFLYASAYEYFMLDCRFVWK